MQRRRLTDPVRLPCGAIVIIKDGLADGRLVHAPLWQEQYNESHGNIVGLAPDWRTPSTGAHTDIERAVASVANFEAAASHNRGGMRLERRMAVSLPDDAGDFCYTSQKVTEGDEALTNEVLAYGSLTDDDRDHLETLLRKADYCAKHIASSRPMNRTFEGFMEDWDTDAIIVALLRRVRGRPDTTLARNFKARFWRSAMAVEPLYEATPTYRLRQRAWTLKLERDKRIRAEREAA